MRSKEVDSGELVKELGDVLFDVLMMIQVAGRAHPAVTLQSCAASACKKLERRSPYLFSGVPVTSLAEAEAAWQAGKQSERDAAQMVDAVAMPSHPSLPTTASPAEDAASSATAMMQSLDVAGLLVPSGRERSGPAKWLADLPGQPSSANAEEEDDDGSLDGLAEWDRDFKRGVGPPSEESDLDDADDE